MLVMLAKLPPIFTAVFTVEVASCFTRIPLALVEGRACLSQNFGKAQHHHFLHSSDPKHTTSDTHEHGGQERGWRELQKSGWQC